MTGSLLRLLPCLTLLAALVGCVAPEEADEEEDTAEPSGFTLEPGEEPDEPDLDLDGAREFSVAWIGAAELVYEGIVYFMATSEPASCPDIEGAFEGDIEDLGTIFILAIERPDIDEDLIGDYSARYNKDCEAAVYTNHPEGLLQEWNAVSGVCSILDVTDDRVEGEFELDGNRAEDLDKDTFKLDGEFSAERCRPIDG